MHTINCTITCPFLPLRNTQAHVLKVPSQCHFVQRLRHSIIRSVPNSIHLASFWNVLSSAPEMSPLSNSKIGRGSVPNVLWGNIVVHDTIQIVTLADSCAHENELFKILWTTNYGYYSRHALETPRVAFLKVVIKKNSHGVGRPNLPSVKGEVLGLSVRLVLDLVIGSLSLASGHVGANKR